jgi:Domain of unknown function DUF1829
LTLTREVRPRDSKAYAVLNDIEQPVPAGVVDAFSNWAINPVPWSRRNVLITELVA